MIPTPHQFRPFTHADLSMVASWLRTPEVVRWWGDSEREEILLAQDLDEPLMRQWIVEHGRCPFAYAQAYPAKAWPQPHLANLPEGAMAVDAFIGEPAMLGRGHGRRFLRLIAELLLAEDAPVIAIDPALNNHRARRAYGHAGFVEEGVFETEGGPVILMLYRRAADHHLGAPNTVA